MSFTVGGEPFIPKSFQSLRDYNAQKFVADLIAGITVGLVALPLAMAFAISSGVLPQSGIYCAIVAGFLISALGGSTVQIGGPTGAFVVVVAGIVQKHGIDGLYMCTMMAGILLMILGVTGLGSAVKFIPRPVVIGFTNGIAVLIASTQLKDFFGLKIAKVPSEFLPRIEAVVSHFGTLSTPTTVLSVGCLTLIILIMRFVKKVPGYIVAMVVGTGIAWALALPLETIETKFGGIPSGLPSFQMPHFRPELILPLLAPTFTVTMLGAIESLLSAVVADRMTGGRHNPNVELFGQGVANFVSPLFGGLPATGAIARTATNIRTGAKTPMSGMIHALTLLVILLVAAGLAKHIPLCVLAAILFVVSYNMGEWKEIPEILKLGKAPVAVWGITFALTVFADLTVAVEAGMILAMLLFVHRISLTTTVSQVTEEYIEDGKAHSLQLNPIPDNVAVFRVHGPFMFGSTDKLDTIYRQIDSLPSVVILRLRNMNALDTTGLKALEELALKLSLSGRHLVLCGLRDQPLNLANRSGLKHHLGEENLTPHVQSAIERAKEILSRMEAEAVGP
ncbi:MAG: STAS domain-containing protein [Armatimonadetes bacterium]|nr:STAS domain-containing protein [Armatimonadota bacterium]MBS1728511.1 STAS domain-containing protein [Armatimonadota bacterium]